MSAQKIEGGTEASAIRSEVEEIERWRRRMEVHVPSAHASQVRRLRVREYARRSRLKGFRPGKAPEALVERQFGDDIEADVLQDLVREGFESGVREGGLDPIGAPRFRNVHWTADGDLEFAAEFDVRPEIELARTTGFRVEERIQPVSDADVERVIERLRHERADWIPVGRPAGAGDRVRFDSVPLDDDGRPMDTERIEDHVVELGTDSVLADFEAGLGGRAAGEETKFEVRFPDDHHNEFLRGRSRTFAVQVKEVSERSLPDLDDAFARSLGPDFDSTARLRERLRGNLDEEARQRARRGVNEALIDEIIAANRIDLPDSMIDQYLGNLLADRGIEEEADRTAEIRKALRPGALRALQRHHILSHLADREGLRATDAEVDAAIEERIDPEKTSVAEARRRLARSSELEDLRFHLTMEHVFAWLRERSEIASMEAPNPESE